MSMFLKDLFQYAQEVSETSSDYMKQEYRRAYDKSYLSCLWWK